MYNGPQTPQLVTNMKLLDTPVLDYPIKNEISILIDSFATRSPDKVALIQGNQTLSYGDFNRHINQIANALIDLGIKKGDRVAMLARNSIRYAEAFFGVLRAGACTVPLPTMTSPEALKLMLIDSQSKVLLLSAAYLEAVAPIVNQLPMLLPEGMIGFDFADTATWRSFDAWRDAAATDQTIIPVDGIDDFNIFYSSGTTGAPKGILHSHAIRRNYYTMGNFDQETINLVSTPFYTNTTARYWLSTTCAGGTNIILPKFEAVEFLRLVQTHRVTHAMLVPVQYERILRVPDFDSFDLSSLRSKSCTSAPLRVKIKQQIKARLPGDMIEFYGLTEGGVKTVLDVNAAPDHKLASVGRPIPESGLKIIDRAGNELPQGEIGEVVGRSTAMMRGYLNREAETEAILWRDSEGNLFFRSGDIGRVDEDGYLYLLDRLKDVIISGGLNIYATDLETVLLEHPAVHEVAVIGVPSDQWGETPLALVVPEADVVIDEEALLNWANARLGKSQRLSGVAFREALPKSDIGKVLKRQLRAPYWRQSTT